MTYRLTSSKVVTTRMIELSLSAAQTASSGDVVLFDVVRSNAGHGVSVNNGVISLDTTRSYWVQASIDVSRSSLTSSWAFGFFDDTATQIAADDGGFPARWDYHSSTLGVDQPNATFTATYVSLSPVTSLTLRATTLAALSVINVGTRVLIFEAEA